MPTHPHIHHKPVLPLQTLSTIHDGYPPRHRLRICLAIHDTLDRFNQSSTGCQHLYLFIHANIHPMDPMTLSISQFQQPTCCITTKQLRLEGIEPPDDWIEASCLYLLATDAFTHHIDCHFKYGERVS